MQPDRRPLPESLTRLLDADPKAVRARTFQAERAPSTPGRRSAHGALESALLRGFVYAVSGLVWLAVLLLLMRHYA